MRNLLPLIASLVACAAAPKTTPTPAAPALQLQVTAKPLPGATGAVSLDYIAVDRAAGKVWVPAGGTGATDVFDNASSTFQRVDGFATVEREVRGAKRMMGPSSVSLGAGFAYVGNRANSAVCAIDQARLTLGACLELPSSPDGVQYVAATKEVWVTTPRDSSLHVLDAADPTRLSIKIRIPLEGEPEGYGVDEGKGLFFTNYEDKNKTVAVDVRTKKVVSTWEAGCSADGPRGLALDTAKGWVFVACTDGVNQLDAANQGARLARLDTGGGVDNIDYLQSRQLVFVASGKAERLFVVHAEQGKLSVVATAPTGPGTRTVVADAAGASYVIDPARGQLLVVAPPP